MNTPTDQHIRQFRLNHGLDLDEEKKLVWMAQLGSFILPLPNWQWRRSIVAAHDSHHLRTGYDTSVKGEMLVAAWELGARVYTDWRARVLCRCLMALGLARYPSATISAYRKGLAERI